MGESATIKLGDKSIELPVVTGSEQEKGIDITKLRQETGYITLDPGYVNTGACTSAITFIDGDKGILRYRGIPIEVLAERSNFLETAFLLMNGVLPNQHQLEAFTERIKKHTMIHEDMRIYFRDVYDHAVRALDLVETYRDLLTGGLDIYLTQMANRTNDIVKGLTILATIMLPLTLVTGYFGMNFEYIPGLKNPSGIWYTTGALVVITVSMLGYFKYKKWL